MSKLDDHIRSFAMSNLLISDEIKNIEKTFNVSLRQEGKTPESHTESYYTQFELSVRAEASTMAKHYELFYCLEKAIRKLISETLSEAAPTNWWGVDLIPQIIVEEVTKRIKAEVDTGVTQRSEFEIDYTTFGELSDIITKNWSLFEPILSNKSAVARIMKSLNVLRGPIAHCCPLADDEADRLHLTIKDWFRLF